MKRLFGFPGLPGLLVLCAVLAASARPVRAIEVPVLGGDIVSPRPSIEIGRHPRTDLEAELIRLGVVHEESGRCSILLVVQDWSPASGGSGFADDPSIELGETLGVVLPDDLTFEGTIVRIRSEIPADAPPRLVVEAVGEAEGYVRPRRGPSFEPITPDALAIERSLDEIPVTTPLLSGKTEIGPVTRAEGTVEGGLFRPAGTPLAFVFGGHWLAGRWIVGTFEHEFDPSRGWATHFDAARTGPDDG